MTVKGGRLAGVIAAGVRFFAGARGGSVGGGGARSSRRGKASQGAARRRAQPRRNQVGAPRSLAPISFDKGGYVGSAHSVL